MLDFTAQIVPPTEELLEIYREADNHRIGALVNAIGIDPVRGPKGEEGQMNPELVRDRSSLSVRTGSLDRLS